MITIKMIRAEGLSVKMGRSFYKERRKAVQEHMIQILHFERPLSQFLQIVPYVHFFTNVINKTCQPPTETL